MSTLRVAAGAVSILVSFAAGCLVVDEHPVFFDVEVDPVGDASFVTTTGWTVVLDQAVLAVGPIYLRDEGLRFRHGGGEELVDPTLAGEMIEQAVVDLSAPGRTIGEGRGTVRQVDVLEPRLESPSPEIEGDASALGDAPAVVRGTATRGAEQVAFTGVLAIDDGDGADEHAAEIELDPFVLADGGTLRLALDPAPWFAGAQFETLTQVDGQGRFVLTPSSQVGQAWTAARLDALAPTWISPP